MTFRGSVPDFQLANPLYIGAQVSFFTVDGSGHATTTLATLFADLTSTTTLPNPQTLDSEGKFKAPVYIEVPVIAQVVGATVGTHSTGIIGLSPDTGSVNSVPGAVVTNSLVRYADTTGLLIKQSPVLVGDTGIMTGGTWEGTPVAEIFGGTNQTSYALGDTLYSSAANTLAKLAGNTTTTKKYLSQTGNGAVSAAPSWAQIVQADVLGLHTSDSPVFAGGTFNGAVAINAALTANSATINGALAISPAASSLTQGLAITQSPTGTITGGTPFQFTTANALNYINVSSDTVNNGDGNEYTALGIIHMSGGSTVLGERSGIHVEQHLTAAMNPAATETDMVGGTFQVFGHVGNSGGGFYGLNSVAYLLSGAIGAGFLTGLEIDIAVVGTATVANKYGISIVQAGTNASQGTASDAAIYLINQAGAVGWKDGILFDAAQAGTSQAVATTGTLIGAGAGTYANGVDFSAVTSFTSFVFASPGHKFYVDTNGNVVVASITLTDSNGITYNGSSSGTLVLQVPAVLGTTVLNLPATNTTDTIATLGATQIFGAGSTWHGAVIAGLYGGTGLTAAAIGDLIYASATTPTWSRLADVAVGSVLVSGGVNTAPAWSANPTLTALTVNDAVINGTAGAGYIQLANQSSAPSQPTSSARLYSIRRTGRPGSARVAFITALDWSANSLSRVYTFPDVSDTIAVLAAAQTLTNKTINGANNTLTVVTANITAANVTYAKIQNVAVSSLMGNATGSPAAPTDISIGATLAFSGAALQTAALTGDVTASANSFVTTVAKIGGGVSVPASPYAVGDLLYASTTTALSRLADGAIGSVLISGGVNTAPSYSKTPQLGASGTLGSLGFGNATSGIVTLQTVTGALGTVTLSLPAVTDTLVARTTTDTLTNKTLTAPVINGGTLAALTGLAVRDTSAAFDVTLAATSSTTLTGGRTLTIDMANAAQTLSFGAWTPYTPTITAQSGTFTTTSAAGRYKTVGKTVFFMLEITITAVGTASGVVNASLPLASVASTASGYGWIVTGQRANDNFMMAGSIVPNSTVCGVILYTGASAIGAGNILVVSGCYESA